MRASTRRVSRATRAGGAGLYAWAFAFVHDAARAGGTLPRVARRLKQALRKPLLGRLPLGGVWLLERALTSIQRGRVQRFECAVTTLPDVMRHSGIEAVDLLKIDVEGAEWEILQGVDEADWPRLRQLVLEGKADVKALLALNLRARARWDRADRSAAVELLERLRAVTRKELGHARASATRGRTRNLQDAVFQLERRVRFAGRRLSRLTATPRRVSRSASSDHRHRLAR